MGILEDVMKALDRIPAWKRINALPTEVESLRTRLDALQAKLHGTAAPACPMCNAPGFARVASQPDETFGAFGVMSDTFRCPQCGHEERRQRETMQR